MVLDVFGDAVHLVFRFMNTNLRVSCRYCVNLTVYLLFFENGSFSNRDGKFRLAVGRMG